RALGRSLWPHGARHGAGLGRAQHRQSCAWRAHHAGRLLRLFPFHRLGNRSFRRAADRHGGDVRARLWAAALRAQSHHPLGSAQHAADHLRAGDRLDLSRPARLQRRCARDQSELRRCEHVLGRDHRAERAAGGVPRRAAARDGAVAAAGADAARARHPRNVAEPRGGAALWRRAGAALRDNLRHRCGARGCGGWALRPRLADRSLYRRGAHRQVLRHRDHGWAREPLWPDPRRAPGAQLARRVMLRLSLLGLAVVILALVPLSGDAVIIQYGIDALLAATVAQAWNILGGYTGYASFGNSAFYGLGTYGTAIAMVKLALPFWVGLALGAALALACAVV